MTMETQALALIKAVEEADSAPKLLNAVVALAKAKIEAGIPTLIDVLRCNNPGAAVAAVEGLVLLGEVAVQPILDSLDGYNYGARAWAIRALAEIKDSRALDLLIAAAETDFALSVRRSAAKGIGTLKWDKLGGEELASAQQRAFHTLMLTAADPEWVVRYATVVGLQAFAVAVADKNPGWVVDILSTLKKIAETDGELSLRARAKLALIKLESLQIVTV